MNHIETQALTVGADRELASPVLDDRIGIGSLRRLHRYILNPADAALALRHAAGFLAFRASTYQCRERSATLQRPYAGTKPAASHPCTYTASPPWCNDR